MAEAGGSNGLQTQGVKVAVAEHDTLGGTGSTAGIKDGTAVIRLAVILGQTHIRARRNHLLPQLVTGLGQRMFAGFGHGEKHIQREGQLIGDLCHQDGAFLLDIGQHGGDLIVELIQGQNGLGLRKIQIEGDLTGSGQR